MECFYIKIEWFILCQKLKPQVKDGLDKLNIQLEKISYNEKESVIKTTHNMLAKGQVVITYNTTYTFGSKGEVKVEGEFDNFPHYHNHSIQYS